MDITRIYLVTNCYDDPFKVYIGKTKNNRKRDHKLRFGKIGRASCRERV